MIEIARSLISARYKYVIMWNTNSLGPSWRINLSIAVAIVAGGACGYLGAAIDPWIGFIVGCSLAIPIGTIAGFLWHKKRYPKTWRHNTLFSTYIGSFVGSILFPIIAVHQFLPQVLSNNAYVRRISEMTSTNVDSVVISDKNDVWSLENANNQSIVELLDILSNLRATSRKMDISLANETHVEYILVVNMKNGGTLKSRVFLYPTSKIVTISGIIDTNSTASETAESLYSWLIDILQNEPDFRVRAN